MIKEAVKRFTYSLAGYTVATFVLVCVASNPDSVYVTCDDTPFYVCLLTGYW